LWPERKISLRAPVVSFESSGQAVYARPARETAQHTFRTRQNLRTVLQWLHPYWLWG
jgi:hypothetical protein